MAARAPAPVLFIRLAAQRVRFGAKGDSTLREITHELKAGLDYEDSWQQTKFTTAGGASMMGYESPTQVSGGIYLRQYARAFAIGLPIAGRPLVEGSIESVAQTVVSVGP